MLLYFPDPPKDEGGAEINKYIVELDDGNGKNSFKKRKIFGSKSCSKQLMMGHSAKRLAGVKM